MNGTVAERARAFLVGLPKVAFVLLVTAMTFVVAVPFYPLAKAVVSAGGDLPGPGMGNAPFLANVFVAVVMVPPIETALTQWAPIMLCTRRFGMSALIAGLISATLFGLMHHYSSIYIFQTFAIGLLLSYTFFLAIARNESPFWMVTAVHALRNAMSLVVLAILGNSHQ